MPAPGQLHFSRSFKFQLSNFSWSTRQLYAEDLTGIRPGTVSNYIHLNIHPPYHAEFPKPNCHALK